MKYFNFDFHLKNALFVSEGLVACFLAKNNKQPSIQFSVAPTIVLPSVQMDTIIEADSSCKMVMIISSFIQQLLIVYIVTTTNMEHGLFRRMVSLLFISRLTETLADIQVNEFTLKWQTTTWLLIRFFLLYFMFQSTELFLSGKSMVFYFHSARNIHIHYPYSITFGFEPEPLFW